jgi:hypothetical protein
LQKRKKQNVKKKKTFQKTTLNQKKKGAAQLTQTLCYFVMKEFL